MSSNAYKVQVSIKTPGGSLVNIPADSAEEAAALLVAVQSLAPEIVRTEQLLAGVHNAAPVVVVNDAPQPQPAPVGGAGGGAAPPSFAPASTSGPASCPHGQRKRIESLPGQEHWVKYYCPLGRDDPNRCAPVKG